MCQQWNPDRKLHSGYVKNYQLSIIMITLFYRMQRSWGKVIFSEECVKNSVHRGDRSHGTPPGRHTPRAGTPPGQVHPPGRYTPRQVHPPGRYTPGQWAGDTHPTGMHSCSFSFCLQDVILIRKTSLHESIAQYNIRILPLWERLLTEFLSNWLEGGSTTTACHEPTYLHS